MTPKKKQSPKPTHDGAEIELSRVYQRMFHAKSLLDQLKTPADRKAWEWFMKRQREQIARIAKRLEASGEITLPADEGDTTDGKR